MLAIRPIATPALHLEMTMKKRIRLILGLALLIDSLQAVLLFLLCSGLQAGRALYEERLLAAQFP